jgi:hypothetical protein
MTGSYTDVRNLDVEGGSVYSLFLVECNNMDIQNCKVGMYTAHGGVYFGAMQDTKFWYNTVTSGLAKPNETIENRFDATGVGDGMFLSMQGTHNFDAAFNRVSQWGHACISGSSGLGPWPSSYWREGKIASNIVFRDSYFINDSIGYGRFIGFYGYNSHTYHYVGGSGPTAIDTTFTEQNVGNYLGGPYCVQILRNLVGKMKAPNQIACRKTLFAWNVLDTVEQPNLPFGQNKAPGMVIVAQDHSGGDSIFILNNVFNRPENAGILFRVTSGQDQFSYNPSTRAVTVTFRGSDTMRRNYIGNNIFAGFGNKPSQAAEAYIPQGVGIQVEYYALDAPLGPNTVKDNVFYTTFAGGANVFYDNQFVYPNQTRDINYFNTTAVSTVLPGWTISGNQNVDPMFQRVTGPTLTKDFSLQPTSPVIGAGVNLADFSVPQGLKPESVWVGASSLPTTRQAHGTWVLS